METQNGLEGLVDTGGHRWTQVRWSAWETQMWIARGPEGQAARREEPGWGEEEGGRQVRRKRGGWSKGDGEGAGQGAETS